MKFGKEFTDQMVPEWIEASMDYAVSDINYKRKGDIENQESEIGKNHHENSTNLWNGNLFIPAEIGQKEKSFFEKMDNELEKVNSFYKVQVEEAKDEAAALGKQMDALIALRKKVKEKDRKGDKATSAASSKVTSPSRASSEEKKQLDFKEEVDKFGENIIKPVSSSNNIDPSLYEHGRTPSDVLECVNIQHTSGGPKSSVERLLLATAEKECSFSREELKEVEVKLKKAFVEFYQKLRHLNQYSFINLSAFSVILEKYEKITSRKLKRSYMKFVDSSYIGSSDEVNNLLNKVEATFVKKFSNSEQGDAIKLLTPKRKREKCSVRFVSGFFCGFSIALIMAVVLIIKTRKLLDKEEATVYLDSIFPFTGFYPGTELHHKEVFLLASGLSVLVLTGCLVQLHIRMDSMIQDYETFVELVPLGLLITQAIRSFEYYICYYGWGKGSTGRKMCHVSDVYIVFYYISAAIPFWIRFLQKEMKHGFNGFTYFSMLLSVIFQSTFRLRKKMTWKVWALASSVVAALANISWDIKMDRGLLQRKSRNFLLTDELLLHHKTPVLYSHVVLSFDMRPLRGKVVTSRFASLEILLRGIWNFFRLENEHLDNVGEYRAFKSLPLPFITYDEKDSKN
ncbi:phosphate transporter PHO1 3-like isoform X1 [Capsicum chacoense]